MRTHPAFASCWDRVDRAQEHSEALAKTWNDFTAGESYQPRFRMDRPVGEIAVGHIYVNPRPLPRALALELGEFLYQLRAALDGAVYASAVEDSQSDPPPNARGLEFPVCTSRAAFAQQRTKIAPLSERRRGLIETVQPYNEPSISDEYRVFNFNRTIAILHDWARKDRHRMLHVFGSWASEAEPLVIVPPPAELAALFVCNAGRLEEDNEIAVIHVRNWTPETRLRANPNVMIDLAVDEDPPPCAANDTLTRRLIAMRVAVGTIVAGLEEPTSPAGDAPEIRS